MTIGSPARRARVRLIVFALAVLACAAPASASFQVLTAGKIARFSNPGEPELASAVVVVGRDRALAAPVDPTCPATSAVEIEAYLQSTFRDAVLANVELDCAKWSRAERGFRYSDPDGTVRSIYYGRVGLRIEIGGSGLAPIGGPVGFVQAQLQIGDATLRARFHNFRRNDAEVVWSRRPSVSAARGEAAFWDALTGDDSSEAREQEAMALLEKAVARDAGDGRSHFLLAMIHLYRFGQRVFRFDDVSPAARDELAAAHASFEIAVPLLWNDATGTGDSRVAGFAAAATYTLGLLDGDEELRAKGLADLARSVEVNSFFNVFDYIPIMQFLPASDPAFQQAYASFTSYLENPETLGCVVSQPEICANAGFAPRNVQGALTLFGDLYAKAGDVAKAKMWYDLVALFPDTATWNFRAALQQRKADPAGRAALYADPDPSNDPPIIGAGPEACAVCHNR